MLMRSFFHSLPLLLLLSSACSRAAAPAGSVCIDPTKVRPDAACTEQYDPVCGCDQKTYPNACIAANAGVTRTTPGACPGGSR